MAARECLISGLRNRKRLGAVVLPGLTTTLGPITFIALSPAEAPFIGCLGFWSSISVERPSLKSPLAFVAEMVFMKSHYIRLEKSVKFVVSTFLKEPLRVRYQNLTMRPFRRRIIASQGAMQTI